MCQHFFPQNCYVFYKHLNTNSAVINNFCWQVIYQTLSIFSLHLAITAPFSSTRTLKFKAQPTNAFFAAVNQMFGGSSNLPTTAERVVIESLSTIQTTEQCSAVVGSWEEPRNIWLTAAKNVFGRSSFQFWSPHVIESGSNLFCLAAIMLSDMQVFMLVSLFRFSLWRMDRPTVGPIDSKSLYGCQFILLYIRLTMKNLIGGEHSINSQ